MQSSSEEIVESFKMYINFRSVSISEKFTSIKLILKID